MRFTAINTIIEINEIKKILGLENDKEYETVEEINQYLRLKEQDNLMVYKINSQLKSKIDIGILSHILSISLQIL